MKEEGYSGVSPHKFKEYLTEFGFSHAINRKKMKVLLPGELEPQSRLCNIFTLRVLRKLGLEESKPTVGDKIVELKKWILKNKDEDGLFGEPKLTKQIESLGLPVQRIIEKLLQDRIIEKSPKIGKFIVVK